MTVFKNLINAVSDLLQFCNIELPTNFVESSQFTIMYVSLQYHFHVIYRVTLENVAPVDTVVHCTPSPGEVLLRGKCVRTGALLGVIVSWNLNFEGSNRNVEVTSEMVVAFQTQAQYIAAEVLLSEIGYMEMGLLPRDTIIISEG